VAAFVVYAQFHLDPRSVLRWKLSRGDRAQRLRRIKRVCEQLPNGDCQVAPIQRLSTELLDEVRDIVHTQSSVHGPPATCGDELTEAQWVINSGDGSCRKALPA
jgi:hypothetical protein